ncbi:MAG: sugar ABC transporter permease [Oscillospiraceae bacterium]|nr:sugar ABC transporter permease [Oscillospiraceae bacterium]
MKKLNLTPYVFIAPHVILFIIMFLIPTLYGIYAAFTNWNIFSSPTWVGFDNFRTIFFNTESTFFRQFWNGLTNTLIFVVITVPFQILIPLFIATLLNTRPKGRGIFQAIFYVPTLLSITSVTLTFLFIFNRSLGLWNNILGVDVNWFGEQPFAWMSIVITTLWWGIGANMLIYIAALGGVDKGILEAASVDGSTGFHRFRTIVLPSILMPLLFTVFASIVAQFNIFGQPLLLTTGGPTESTHVLLMYIRNLAFGMGNPIAGMASAMAVVLGLIIGIVSLGQLFVIKRLSGEES